MATSPTALPTPEMPADLQLIPGTVKALYHIVKGKGRKSYWRKFGAAFVNRDGSINLLIDLFPGQHFQIRDVEPYVELEESEVEEIVEEKINGKKKAKQ